MNLLLIGASAGSVDTIERLLLRLNIATSFTILAIHMKEAYIQDFCELLQMRICKEVEILKEFSPLQRGVVYVCDTDRSTIDVCHGNDTLYVRYNEAESSIYRPDIDYLFKSVAVSELAKKCVAMLLSGIGTNGVNGLKMLKEQGSLTLVACEEEAPIYGIPKAAVEADAHCKEVNIDEAIRLIERFWDA